jgi:8-oxo-dGTP pyrophosphatase MutT (NUDIX family)
LGFPRSGTSDSSLEAAARREAYEETGGVEISDPKYLGSSHIDDWRYRDSPDGITTVLFLSTYIYGRPVASDDLAHLEWVDLTTAKERLVTYHHLSSNTKWNPPSRPNSNFLIN